MGFFSPKVKAEQFENVLIQLQEQIVENGKLKAQLYTEIENSKQLNNDYAEQVNKNDDLKGQLRIQEEKANQISEQYNKLISEYKKLRAYSVNLETQLHEYEAKEQAREEAEQAELRKMFSMEDFTYEPIETEKYEKNCKDLEQKVENRCFKCIPIVYQNPRKTSLETWIDKLEKYISKNQKSSYKKEVQSAIHKLENCKKGLEGENSLKQNLLELRNKNVNLSDMIILQDLCFKSPFKNDDGYRKNIQIDFLVITKFVIFIFDSKYRTGVEIIDNHNSSSVNMQEYRKDIMKIISQSGLKEKFNINDSNIYAVMVYSGKNEINHSGFNVKSTDNNSGYCEECDEIQYIFNDNLVNEISGVYSHAGRKQKSIGFDGLSPNDIAEIADSILDYTCRNSYDFNLKCPLCGKDIVERSGRYGKFVGCTGYKSGCNYSESMS